MHPRNGHRPRRVSSPYQRRLAEWEDFDTEEDFDAFVRGHTASLSTSAKYAAVIVVPSAESPSGWADHAIERTEPDRKKGSVGFRG